MRKFTLLFFVSTLLLTACKKHPEASFSPDKPAPELGDTIIMRNASLDAFTYIWTFGDGTTSTEESPAKVYDRPGTYTVTLTAFSEDETRSSQAVNNIVIAEPDFYVYMVLDESVVMHYAKDSILNGNVMVPYLNTQSEQLTGGPPTAYGAWISKIETGTNEYFSVYHGMFDWPHNGTPPRTPPNADFVSFFAPTSYAPKIAPGVDGTEVNYWINGERWSSSLGDQTGSVFSIISTEVDTLSTIFTVKSKFYFDCKLYHSSGDSKKATGTFVGRFANKD